MSTICNLDWIIIPTMIVEIFFPNFFKRLCHKLYIFFVADVTGLRCIPYPCPHTKITDHETSKDMSDMIPHILGPDAY